MTNQHTETTRRLFLKNSLAVSSIGVAVGAGLLKFESVLANWNSAAFNAKNLDEVINHSGGIEAIDSKDIYLKAPEIAENGQVVPVTVKTSLPAENISILASNNPLPLTSSFDIKPGTSGFIATRIKMSKAADLIVIVKANGKLYKTQKPVKVTMSGC